MSKGKKIKFDILKALNEKKTNGTKVDVQSFDVEDGKHELAFYLSDLKRDGQVTFEGEVITTGGQRHEKFGNSVAMIWWDNAHITNEGINYLKENVL